MVTVPTEQTWKEWDVTTASTGPFTFDFPFFAKEDLAVLRAGVRLTESQWTLTPGSGSATAGYDGGSFVLGAAAENQKVVIFRDTVGKRDSNLTGGGMSPTAIDAAFNRETMHSQEFARDIDRAIKFPVDEGSDFTLSSATARANKVLGFDANGNVTYLPDTSEANYQAYVDAEVQIYSVDTAANFRLLTANEYPVVALESSWTTRGDVVDFNNVNDVELWRWNALSKETDDGYRVIRTSDTGANEAGRYERALITDKRKGDTPLPLGDHLSDIYEGMDNNSMSRALSERFEFTPAAFNGFRVPATSTAAQAVPSATYIFPTFAAATFDSMGAFDSATSKCVFTANRDCVLDLYATVDMAGTYAANSNIRLDLVKLGTQGSELTIENFDWNNSRVEVEIDSHGLAEGNIVSVSGLTTNTGYNGRLFSVSNQMTISGAALNNPLELTITGHGYQTGQQITVTGVVGTTELNGNTYTITVIDPNTVSLDGIDGTTGFTAYTSGGVAANVDMFWLTNYDGSAISTADTSGSVYFEATNVGVTILGKHMDNPENDGIFADKAFDVSARHAVLTAGDRFALRVYQTTGNAFTILQVGTNYISAICHYQEPIVLDEGRNGWIFQGEHQLRWADVEEHISSVYKFDVHVLSGVASIRDAAAVAGAPTLFEDTWPVDTDHGYSLFGLTGLNVTKYPHQRQLVRGIRAKNDRALVFGYVTATADAPAGSFAGYGTTALGGISIGTSSVTGCTAALNLTTGVTTVTKTAHGYVTGNIVFMSGFTEMTHLNNKTFKVRKIDNDNFALQSYTQTGDHTPVAISDITVEGDGKVLVTTSTAHGFSTGEYLAVYGVLPFTIPYVGQGVLVEKVSNTTLYLKDISTGTYYDGSAHDAYTSGGYIGRYWYGIAAAFTETTGGTVRNYWDLTDRPTANDLKNYKRYCRHWKADGVDGVFIDLCGSPWVKPAVLDEVLRITKAFKLRAICNVTTPSALAADFVLNSKYFGAGDMIYVEGAYQQGVEDTSSTTAACANQFDARKPRGAQIFFHYTDYEGARRAVDTVFLENPMRVTFTGDHGFNTGDTIAFGRLSGTTELNDILANSSPKYLVVKTSDTEITLQDTAGSAIDGTSGYSAHSASADDFAVVTTPAPIKTITGATKADPVVITTSGNHNFITGDQVRINRIADTLNESGDVIAKSELNGRSFTVTRIDATSFSLNSEDGTNHPDYTSGGTVVSTVGADTTAARYVAFKGYIDARTGTKARDVAGASTTGLGGSTLNLPIYESDWEPIGGIE